MRSPHSNLTPPRLVSANATTPLGCDISAPFVFLDRTGSPSHPTVPILGGAFSIILQRTGVALDFFTLPTATFLAGKYFSTAVVSIREVYAMAAR